MLVVSALIGIATIIGCIYAFGWWGIPALIVIYVVLGALAKHGNPGKTEDKYGNWR